MISLFFTQLNYSKSVMLALLIASASARKYGAPVALGNFVPITAELNGTHVLNQRIGLPDTNDVEAFEFQSDIIPGGYRPEDCECYPCSVVGDENGDIEEVFQLEAKLKRQRKKIRALKRQARDHL